MAITLPSLQNVGAQTIGSVLGGVPVGDALSETLSAAAANVQGSLKAALDSETSASAAAARESQGAQDLADLATNGFDPDSTADQGKMVGVVAGGLCLVPVVGPLLGAIVAGAYGLVKILSGPLSKLWPAGTFTSGNWKPSQFLGWMATPPTTRGTFADIAVKTLAISNADFYNAKPQPPPAATLAGIAELWNQKATGAAVDVFVPAMRTWLAFGLASSGPILRTPPGGAYITDGIPRAGPFVSTAQASYAFRPIAQVPDAIKTLVITQSSVGAPILPASSIHLKGSSLPPPLPPASQVRKVIALKIPTLAALTAAASGATPAAATSAVKKVITLKVAGLKAPATPVHTAAEIALSHERSYWVLYYAQQAKLHPLTTSHPFAATIAHDLTRT